MKSARWIIALGALAIAACDDAPLKSRAPAEPPPPAQGIQEFLTVDNDQARPGDQVQVFFRVQMGTGTQSKVGSYTGRLAFDPGALAWVRDVDVNDGLRVVNPGDASKGEVRFAGASASGFSDLLLYQGVYEVKKADYLKALGFKLDEISAALTLGNLGPELKVAPQIFLQSVAP